MSDDPSKTKVLPDGPAGELPVGAELSSGMYRVTGRIAAGGFGITYEARDNLDRKVAIKECFPAGLALRAGDFTVSAASASTSEPFETARNLFLREARTLANLRHPNIVHVQTLFEENGTAYMAMDYVEGHDLQHVIEHEPQKLTPAYVMELTRTLLNALDYLHRDAPERGKERLLHRDIKPANIRIDPLDTPVIIDFGAARQETKAQSRAAGTFRVVSDGYSPNEFYVAGTDQGPSSDLYSLAATLHHCITGAAPVPADERAQKVSNGEDDPYHPIAGRFPGHDPRLLALIDRALSRPMKDRPADAAAWFAAIPDTATRIVEAAPVAAAVAAPPPPPAQGASGFWKGAAMGGGLLALLGGGAYLALPGADGADADMQRQLTEVMATRDGLEVSLSEMETQANSLLAEVATATEARDLAQARVGELGDTIDTLRAQLDAAAEGDSATTITLRNQLNQALTEQDGAQLAQQALEAEVANLQAALASAEADAAAEQAETEARAATLAAELAALEAAIAEGGDTIDTEALRALEAERDTALRNVERARSDLERMAQNLSDAEAEANRLAMELREARSEIDLMRANAVTPTPGPNTPTPAGGDTGTCPSWDVPGSELSYTGTEIYTPQTVSVRASGTLNVGGCAGLPFNAAGFTDQIPDITLYTSEMAQFRRLQLEVEAPCGTTLLVNTNDTNWHFDHNSGEAGGPLLDLTGQIAIEGRIDIWIGTLDGAACDATLEMETWLN